MYDSDQFFNRSLTRRDLLKASSLVAGLAVINCQNPNSGPRQVVSHVGYPTETPEQVSKPAAKPAVVNPAEPYSNTISVPYGKADILQLYPGEGQFVFRFNPGAILTDPSGHFTWELRDRNLLLLLAWQNFNRNFHLGFVIGPVIGSPNFYSGLKDSPPQPTILPDTTNPTITTTWHRNRLDGLLVENHSIPFTLVNDLSEINF